MLATAWVSDGSTSNYQTRHVSETPTNSWNESLPFTALCKKVLAKLCELSSVQVVWLCIGCLSQWAAVRKDNSNVQEFFCMTHWWHKIVQIFYFFILPGTTSTISIEGEQWTTTMIIFALLSMTLRSLLWLTQSSKGEKTLAIMLSLSCCFLLYSLVKQYVERYVVLSKI